MRLIREFESALDGFKKQGVYRGIGYSHAGPAHLSIGQEAGRRRAVPALGPA